MVGINLKLLRFKLQKHTTTNCFCKEGIIYGAFIFISFNQAVYVCRVFAYPSIVVANNASVSFGDFVTTVVF